MKKPRTLAQLKAHPWVQGVEEEDDNGYWLYLKSGYWSPQMETSSLHEMTVRDLCNMFNLVEPGNPE